MFWDDVFLDGVAVLEETPLLVLGGPVLLSLGFDADAPLLDCVRDGDLSMAGDAGDRELEDVEDVGGRFLGLLSASNPVLPEVLLPPILSVLPFLCFISFKAIPCRGLMSSALLFSPVGFELLCSVCTTDLKRPCSISLFVPTLVSKAARADFPPDILSGLGEPEKHGIVG